MIQLTDKVRLVNPLTLGQIKAHPTLSKWSFARYQQGVMRHARDVKEEGAWQALRALLSRRNPSVEEILKQTDPFPESQEEDSRKKHMALRLFLCYASEDLERVCELHQQLNKDPALRRE